MWFLVIVDSLHWHTIRRMYLYDGKYHQFGYNSLVVVSAWMCTVLSICNEIFWKLYFSWLLPVFVRECPLWQIVVGDFGSSCCCGPLIWHVCDITHKNTKDIFVTNCRNITHKNRQLYCILDTPCPIIVLCRLGSTQPHRAWISALITVSILIN